MQNTMIGGGGGGGWPLGKKLRVRGGKKAERKTEENYIKNTGKKALKMHLFGL